MAKKVTKFLIIFYIFTLTGCFAQGDEKLAVNVAVADICSAPRLAKENYEDDNNRLTQVLYGEFLIKKGEKGDWYEVEAVEQFEFTQHSKWQGYTGWIQKDRVVTVGDFPKKDLVITDITGKVYLSNNNTDQAEYILPIGTRLVSKGEKGRWCEIYLVDGRIGWIQKDSVKRISDSLVKNDIVKTAQKLLNIPYLWGGRSPFSGRNWIGGIDCSGLINLIYGINGRNIPRDAHEQYLKCRKISKEELKEADLIFWSKKDSSEKINHVALYCGNSRIIDSPGLTGSGRKIRNIAFDDWLKERKDGYIKYGRID